MSSETQHTPAVDVALGIVVDKMSPHAVPAEPANCATPPDSTPDTTPRILITRRKPDQVLGGYWELPGGKLEPGETPADAVVRELREEVGIDVEPIKTLHTVDHRYEHAHVRLIPFICRHIAGEPQPLHVDAVRWVTADNLNDYAFPQASLPILRELTAWLGDTSNPPHARP